jgi:hypothetical protein
MGRDAKIWKFTRLLIAKHGKATLELVRQRAQNRLDRGDYRASSGWARVADIVKRVTKTGARRLPAKATEPPLEDVLAGQTTKAMMQADGVDRQQLDKIVGAAQQKLEGDK